MSLPESFGISRFTSALPVVISPVEPAHSYRKINREPLRGRTVLGGLLLLYAFTFSVLTTVLLRAHGFPLDDSYIHQTVARNFARYGTPGFNVGQHSSGATSLLWTFLQAFNFRCLHAVDPVWYNIALSYLLICSVGILLYVIARRDGLPQRTCLILAVAPALLGNFLWLGMIAMEHVLFVVLSLLGIFLWFDSGMRATHSAWFAGFVAALLVLTRPEAILYGPLLLVLGYRERRRSRADLAKFIGVWLSAVLLTIAANWWTSGSFMPATLKGRTWLYFHGSGGVHSAKSMLRFVGSWIERLPRFFSGAFTSQPKTIHDFTTPGAVLGVALLTLILLGSVTLLRRGPLGIGVLLYWAALHLLTYLAFFPAGGHGGRYQPLCLLLAFPLLLIGLDTLWASVMPHSPDARSAIVLSVLVIGGVSSLNTWRRVTYLGVLHINNTHGRAAAWMNEHIPLNARFAAFDIGRVSYDWQGQVIDLGGLVDPAYYTFLQQGRVPDYLAEKKVQYVLLPSTGMEDLGLRRQMFSRPLVSYCTPTNDWLLGFRYTIHATPCQTLYEIKTP